MLKSELLLLCQRLLWKEHLEYFEDKLKEKSEIKINKVGITILLHKKHLGLLK